MNSASPANATETTSLAPGGDINADLSGSTVIETPDMTGASRTPDKAPPAKAADKKVATKEALKEKAAPAAAAAPPAVDPKAAAAKERGETLKSLDELVAARRAAFAETQRAQAAREAAEATKRAAETEGTTLKAEASKALAELRAAKASPQAAVRWLEQQGVTAKVIADAVMKGADPQSEVVTALSTKLDELQAKIDSQAAALAAKDAEAKEQAARAAAAEAFNAAKVQLIQTFDSKKDSYPTLHAYLDTKEEVVEEVLALLSKIRNNPVTAPYATEYSNEDLLEALEARYSKKLERLKAPAGTAATDTGSTKTGETQTNGKGQKSRTLSNATSTEQSNAPPADIHTWPKRKQTAYFAEMLKKATRG
jgi:hypothetical protein